jgi:cytochrome P450
MDMPQHLADALVSAETYSDFDKIHDVFRTLRLEAPVSRAKPKGYEPFWFIGKYDDVQFVEKDNELFHAGDKQTVLTTLNADAETRKLTGGSPHMFRTLVQMDEPDHGKYRALTQSWFGPSSLRNLEPKIRRRAKAAVDAMAQLNGACDFATDVALQYPLGVIMEILGVPEEHRALMLKLTQQVFGAEDADMNTAGHNNLSEEERVQATAAVAQEVFAYFNALTAERRRHPRDDLATVIANGIIDGAPIGDVEALSYYVITATAGHDTTSNSASAAMWALCAYPGMLAELKAQPDLIPNFVEESIRWEAPVKHFMRTATRDTEIRGVPIAKDDWMMVSFASACRDEDTYEDPFVYNIKRKPNRHMALGYGPHVCLGQHLARLEMRIFWEELIARLDHVEMTGPVKRVSASFVSGPKNLPIAFSLRD